MPLYTYRCIDEKCNHTVEKIVKIAEREEEQPCEQCNGSMKFEPYTAGDKGSNLYFRGNWFATQGRY